MEENSNIQIENIMKEIDTLTKIYEQSQGSKKAKVLTELQDKKRELVALNKINDPMYNILGRRLREMREKLKMSQASVAESVGLKQLAVMNYENGKRTPDAKTLRAFAKLYGCSADYLLGLSDFRDLDKREKFDTHMDELIKKISRLEPETRELMLLCYDALISSCYVFDENTDNSQIWLNIVKLLDELISMVIFSCQTIKNKNKSLVDNEKSYEHYLNITPIIFKRHNALVSLDNLFDLLVTTILDSLNDEEEKAHVAATIYSWINKQYITSDSDKESFVKMVQAKIKEIEYFDRTMPD